MASGEAGMARYRWAAAACLIQLLGGDEPAAVRQNDGNAIDLFSQNALHHNNMEIMEMLIGTNRQSRQIELPKI
jgi:hypothetical protein